MPQLFAGLSAALLEHGTVIIDLHLLQAIHALSPSVTGPALHSCLSPVIISCMPASCTDDVLHASCFLISPTASAHSTRFCKSCNSSRSMASILTRQGANSSDFAADGFCDSIFIKVPKLANSF